MSNTPKKVLVGVTGASGSIYAERLISLLLDQVDRVYIVVTESGRKVVSHELPQKSFLGRTLSGKLDREEQSKIRFFGIDDLFAPCASGTSVPDSMVVVPASMGTLSRIANGNSGNLLERSADVVLKQRKQLIICPRETPFNVIHLENLLKLGKIGVEILPLMPGFYQKPQSIDELVDFCVGKIMEQLGFPHTLYKPWNHRML